jgi:hypothetical protein
VTGSLEHILAETPLTATARPSSHTLQAVSTSGCFATRRALRRPCPISTATATNFNDPSCLHLQEQLQNRNLHDCLAVAIAVAATPSTFELSTPDTRSAPARQQILLRTAQDRLDSSIHSSPATTPTTRRYLYSTISTTSRPSLSTAFLNIPPLAWAFATLAATHPPQRRSYAFDLVSSTASSTPREW